MVITIALMMIIPCRPLGLWSSGHLEFKLQGPGTGNLNFGIARHLGFVFQVPGTWNLNFRSAGRLEFACEVPGTCSLNF